MANPEKDLRIEEGQAVEGLLGHTGFKVLLQGWQAIKHKALNDLTSEVLDDSTLKARQVIYNQISEWIDLPEKIIQRGVEAVAEQEDERIRKEHPIKRGIPFIGRKY